MTERSIFNLICKLGGLWLLLQGLSRLLWEFIASRNTQLVGPEMSESFNWFPGAVYTVVGLLFMIRSASLTRFLFRLDGSLGDSDSSSPENG